MLTARRIFLGISALFLAVAIADRLLPPPLERAGGVAGLKVSSLSDSLRDAESKKPPSGAGDGDGRA